VTQALAALGLGLGVDAADERHIQRVEQPRHGLVGLHHEHLDQRVREAVVLLLRPDDAPFFVQFQLDFRQVQHQLPIVQPALLNPLRQVVHVVQQLHHLRRVVAQRLVPVGVPDLLRAVDDGLRLAVAQPLGALDHGVGELRPRRPAVLVDRDEHALAEARDRLLQ
jgi:hypothetical protein